MDLDNAAAFMLGSIGYGIGIIVMVSVVVAINNVISRFWKPIQFFKWADHPATRFMTHEEMNRVTPHLEDENGKEKTSQKV